MEAICAFYLLSLMINDLNVRQLSGDFFMAGLLFVAAN